MKESYPSLVVTAKNAIDKASKIDKEVRGGDKVEKLYDELKCKLEGLVD